MSGQTSQKALTILLDAPDSPALPLAQQAQEAFLQAGRSAQILAAPSRTELRAYLEAHPDTELFTAFSQSLQSWKNAGRSLSSELSSLGIREGDRMVTLLLARDKAGNTVCICTIEHGAGGLLTAPAQSLRPRELNLLRSRAQEYLLVEKHVGLICASFLLTAENGAAEPLSLSPVFSASWLLAEKATGYPLGRVAVLLSTGCLLEQIPCNLPDGATAFCEPSLFESVSMQLQNSPAADALSEKKRPPQPAQWTKACI